VDAVQRQPGASVDLPGFLFGGDRTRAGISFGAIFEAGGLSVIFAGAILTACVTVAVILLGYRYLKLPFSAVMGMITRDTDAAGMPCLRQRADQQRDTQHLVRRCLPGFDNRQDHFSPGDRLSAFGAGAVKRALHVIKVLYNTALLSSGLAYENSEHSIFRISISVGTKATGIFPSSI
jgi:hypothetical protein